MRIVPNFTRYAADENGIVYSLNYKRTGKIKAIKPAVCKHGYHQSMFQRNDGKYCTMKIHKVVCLAFYGERGDNMEVNHINGIKTDNRPSNLEYCTHSQNCQHSFDTGLQLPKRGTLNGNSKLSDEDVIAIRNHAKNFNGRYYGRKGLAEKYGVSIAHIKDIVTNRRGIWGHLK